MASSFQKKTSRIFLTIFIGFIAVSFMFTGYESSMGRPDTVARVGSEQISLRDYFNEYNRQLQFYQQMFGQDLTAQQIETFGIKQSALDGLVQQALLDNLATKLGVTAAPEAIKNEIRTLPYFQTANRFDIEKYRQLLAANSLTPSEFEDLVRKQIQREAIIGLLSQVPVSKSMATLRNRLSREEAKAFIVEIEDNALRQSINITPQEINELLADQTRLEQIRNMFESRRSQLDRPEEVTASHILLQFDDLNKDEVFKKANEILEKATPRNFARLAEEHSEDPSAQGQGGSLGRFSRGQMVPEFEEAVFEARPGQIIGPIESPFGLHIIWAQEKHEEKIANFDDYKNELATELIRSLKTDEVAALREEISGKLLESLKSKNFRAAENLAQNYNLKFNQELTINRLDGVAGQQFFLRPNDIQKIFTDKNQDWHIFSSGTRSTILSIKEHSKPSEEQDKSLAELSENLSGPLAQKLQEEFMNELRSKIKINIWSNRVF